MLNRFKEDIQHIIMNNSYIDDKQCEIFINQIKKLKRLKTLKFDSNILTKVTLQRIIDMYDPLVSFGATMKKSAKNNDKLCYLEVLDLRNNSLIGDDGLMLYSSFIGPLRICTGVMKSLNGLYIDEVLNDKDLNMLDMEGNSVRITEIVLICELLKEISHITYLNFKNNFIDVKAGILSAKYLYMYVYLFLHVCI